MIDTTTVEAAAGDIGEFLLKSLQDRSFTERVLNSTHICVVAVHSAQCGSVALFQNGLTKLAWRHVRDVEFFMLDVAHAPAAAFLLNVDELPTAVVFANGLEAHRLSGNDLQRLQMLLWMKTENGLPRPLLSTRTLGLCDEEPGTQRRALLVMNPPSSGQGGDTR